MKNVIANIISSIIKTNTKRMSVDTKIRLTMKMREWTEKAILFVIFGEYKEVDVKESYIIYKKNGEYHREDGPAVENIEGKVEYWIEGKRHRINGPSAIWPCGKIMYTQHGKLHNKNGPALITKRETITEKTWYYKGKRIKTEVIDSTGGIYEK